MPRTADVTSDVIAPAETPAEPKSETVKVTVPQDSGPIVINTFDTKTPHRFTASGGVVETDSAGAALLVARVEGASISS